METTDLPLPGLRLLRPRVIADERGSFAESWRETSLPGLRFVQDTISLSSVPGTVRGLHFQAPPHAQDTLIILLTGSLVGVAVDIRRGSPTFGRFHAVKLLGRAHEMLLVPAGFAHGFCTLEADTLVATKVTAYHAPDSSHGVAWDDPEIGIPWPIPPGEAVLSPRDRSHPRLSRMRTPFVFKG